MRVSRWYRLFALHAPVGLLDTTLYLVVLYAYFIGLWLLAFVPLLFLRCGRDLCGFFE